MGRQVLFLLSGPNAQRRVFGLLGSATGPEKIDPKLGEGWATHAVARAYVCVCVYAG